MWCVAIASCAIFARYLSDNCEGWERLFQGVDTNAFHNSSTRKEISEVLPKQYQEVIRRAADWATASAVTEHTLWVHGSSCTSSIARAVASLQEEGRVFFATYFVSENPDNEEVRTRFIPTIAYQLGLFFPRVREELGNILAHDPSILSRSISHQLDSLILQPLAPFLKPADDEVDGQHHPVVIIVDGCDSLDDSTRTSVVNALFKCAQQFPLRVRLLLFTKLSTGLSATLISSVEDGSITEISFAGKRLQVDDKASYSFPLNLGAILQMVWIALKTFVGKNGRT